MDITGWRRKIDEIDTAMLHLLNLRTELAVEVARMKNLEGLALRAPARERAIVARMKRLNPGPLEARSVGKIYELILAESIHSQERYYAAAAAAARRGSRAPVGARAMKKNQGGKKRP